MLLRSLHADGSPIYRGIDRTDRWLFFDRGCGSLPPSWLLGGLQPSKTADRDLQGSQPGGGCYNDAHMRVTDGSEGLAGLPLGTNDWHHVFCGETAASGGDGLALASSPRLTLDAVIDCDCPAPVA